MATKSLSPQRVSGSSSAQYDWGLLSIVVTLMAFGTVMVFSASFAQGIFGFDDALYFFFRQLVWLALGTAALIVAARIPYTIWERWSIPLMGITFLALIAVIAFGNETFGSTRTFLGGSIQPSEPAKVIVIIYVSAWLASKGSRIRDVQVGLIPFAVLMGAISVLLVSQPDISTSILIVLTAMVMFFIAGAELRQLFVVAIGGTATFWLIIHYSSYARGRVERYLASIWDPLHSAEWQTWQGIQALLRGGVFGVGLGNSQAKMPGYLPVSWSDNIFAVIGEELGVLGALVVILLFALLAYRGLRAALRAPDNFGMLLATGITALLTLQAILNTAVAVAVAPPTGVTLPFISYGGSSLVTVLGAAGILLSVSRAGGPPRTSSNSSAGKGSNARFDFRWRDRRSRLPSASSKRPTSSASRSTSGRSTTRRTARTKNSV